MPKVKVTFWSADPHRLCVDDCLSHRKSDDGCFGLVSCQGEWPCAYLEDFWEAEGWPDFCMGRVLGAGRRGVA